MEARMKRNPLLSRLFLGFGDRAWFLALTRVPTITIDTMLLRRSQGRAAVGDLLGAPSLLLTTTGRRSGQPRHTPLFYFPHDNGHVVVASNFGRPEHPSWSANLLAQPRAEVTLAGRTFPVTARLLAGDERAAAWERITAFWKGYETYRTRTSRELRVFVLEEPAA
jgi:deazaflavin-dependent oxidoreductase (nitroreductase family)